MSKGDTFNRNKPFVRQNKASLRDAFDVRDVKSLGQDATRDQAMNDAVGVPELTDLGQPFVVVAIQVADLLKIEPGRGERGA